MGMVMSVQSIRYVIVGLESLWQKQVPSLLALSASLCMEWLLLKLLQWYVCVFFGIRVGLISVGINYQLAVIKVKVKGLYSFSCEHILELRCQRRAREGHFQARPYYLTFFARTSTSVPRRSHHSSHQSYISTSATFHQPTPAHCASLLTQHVRPSPGFSGCR